MADKYMIMFVCTGNTCRSPMAEGAMRTLLSGKRLGKFEVISSGTSAQPGFQATEYAVEAAKIWKSDISEHKSQPLESSLIDEADLIFAMTPGHYEQILSLRSGADSKSYLLKKFTDGGSQGEGVADPIGQSLDMYNRTFLEIGEQLGKHLDEILRRIDEKIND